jgi:hypothetical protein
VNPTCSKCQFFNADFRGPHEPGWCYRYPPNTFWHPVHVQIEARVSETWGSHWCGEFKEREQP